jgi:uncharacterized protein with NAD-binding domain and iron-sulfur cluster
MSGPRKKIAILGGGPAAIAAAFKLTETPELQAEHEVTVYQIGWRLGGKCASGRDKDARIQEHGLHILGGCYDYTFQMLRRCYDEWAPPAGTKKWQIWEAFKEHREVTLQEEVAPGQFEPWCITFPPRSGEPGDRTVEPTIWGLLGELLPFIHRQTPIWADHGRSQQDLRRAAKKLPVIFQPFAEPAVDFYVGSQEQPDGAPGLPLVDYADIPITDLENMDYGEIIGLAAAEASYMAELEELGAHHFISPEEGVKAFLHFALSRYQRGLELFVAACKDKRLRRFLLAIRAAIAVAIGLVTDLIPFRGFDVIDHMDLREWLQLHGAADKVAHSLVINPGYDYAFAYENGDTNRPQLAAGVGIHAFLRLLLTYRGAIFFEMQAAMGEVVFVPLYDVLQARGVAFKFFHRVEKLNVSTGGRSRLIDSVDLAIQMTTKAGAPYDPLIAIPLPDGETHRCWPSGPRLDQLVRGDELNADLEDPEARGPAETALTLRQGQDYDTLILAIPIGEFPRICDQLIAASPRWADMVQNVKTVGTMALQLWLNRTTADLGGIQPATIMTSFVQPLNTWADMTHLAHFEGAVPAAQSIAYFCGPLNEAVDGSPRRRAATHDDPCRRAVDWSENLPQIWPNMQQRKGLAPSDPRLESPDIDATFFRRNDKDPDRYVLTLPGSTKYRLAPDQSGFANLYLAGDWTCSGIDIGCLEAAVLSGIQAGEAIASPDGKLHHEPDGANSDIVDKAQETASELANTGEAVVAAGADALLTLSDLIFGGRAASRRS